MAHPPYRVEVQTSARRQLRKLDGQVRRRIIKAVEALADNPRPSGCQPLSDGQGEYRIRVGDYRVIYAVEEERLLVLVLAAGHRKDVYEKWQRMKGR